MSLMEFLAPLAPLKNKQFLIAEATGQNAVGAVGQIGNVAQGVADALRDVADGYGATADAAVEAAANIPDNLFGIDVASNQAKYLEDAVNFSHYQESRIQAAQLAGDAETAIEAKKFEAYKEYQEARNNIPPPPPIDLTSYFSKARSKGGTLRINTEAA